MCFKSFSTCSLTTTLTMRPCGIHPVDFSFPFPTLPSTGQGPCQVPVIVQWFRPLSDKETVDRGSGSSGILCSVHLKCSTWQIWLTLQAWQISGVPATNGYTTFFQPSLRLDAPLLRSLQSDPAVPIDWMSHNKKQWEADEDRSK